jgi:copper(I)-binding protein
MTTTMTDIIASMRKTFRSIFIAASFAAVDAAHAAGQLVVEQAWIRAAPPGTGMLAGYAVLHNRGDEALSINAVSSAAFASASLHETREEGGVSKMRALPSLLIAPGASVKLAPGGKHLMLMQPKGDVAAGKSVNIDFALGDKARVSAEFTVRDDAPPDDDAH